MRNTLNTIIIITYFYKEQKIYIKWMKKFLEKF